MKTLRKKIVVNGQELVMSSMDGRSWFLKSESMYEFEKRMRQAPSMMDHEIEDLEPVLSKQSVWNAMRVVPELNERPGWL